MLLIILAKAVDNNFSLQNLEEALKPPFCFGAGAKRIQ